MVRCVVLRSGALELGVSDIDLLCTLTELTAKQIALACARFGGPGVVDGATDEVLLRGGICNNRCAVHQSRDSDSLVEARERNARIDTEMLLLM